MERDSLLSHGTSFLLQDRLTHCSDECQTLVCKRCGSLVSPILETSKISATDTGVRCATCSEDAKDDPDVRSSVVPISVPYVFRYLVAELLSMNIKLSLNIKAEH